MQFLDLWLYHHLHHPALLQCQSLKPITSSFTFVRHFTHWVLCNISVSVYSRRGSPTPSLSSSQSVGLGTSQLTAAAHRKQESSVGLTPSLANYINPKLMDHVSGWLVDPAEVQVCWSTCASKAWHNDYRNGCFAPEDHGDRSIEHAGSTQKDWIQASSLHRITQEYYLLSCCHQRKSMMSSNAPFCLFMTTAWNEYRVCILATWHNQSSVFEWNSISVRSLNAVLKHV